MKRRNEMKFVTCPGSKIHTHYEPQFDGKTVVLVESGVTDIQDEIESYGRYTDMHYMLHRLSIGDRNVLTKRTPLYGDFTGMPGNPVDAINLLHTAESRFAEMSLEERATYNNDYRMWLATVLSGKAVSVDSVPAVNPAGSTVNTEVKEEDNNEQKR